MQEFQPVRNRRGWIKNAAIIFLSVLLVLTFFSNTIMNISLPEVAAVYTTAGTITNKISVTGNIEPNESYGVFADGTYTLRTVNVRVGDTVEKDQELASYEFDVSDELRDARKTLSELQNAYDLAVLESDSSGSYDKAYRDLERVKKDADDAWAKYNAHASLYSIPAGDPALKVAALEEEQKQLQKNVDAFKEDMTDFSTLHEKITTLQAQKDAAQKAYEDAKKIVNGESDHTPSEEEIENARQTMRVNADLIERLMTEINLCYEKLNNLSDLITADSTQEQILSMLEGSLETVTDQLAAYNKAVELYTAAQTADKAYEDKKYEVQELIDGYEKADQKAQLTLKGQKDALEAQKQLVADLEAKSKGATVLSPVAGVITTIFSQAGEKVSGGAQLFAIELSGKGYLLKTTMTADQARQIKVGDKATVQDWWYGEIDVTVSAIKNDPSNPGRSNIVEFVVTGDVSAGQTLKLSVGSRSASYDVLVPNSAVREDSNGKFVLIVNSKSSPLGNRYFAKRVDVTALASDDKYTAVSGELFGSEYVITTSTSPIESGTQVRLAE
jgi:multidrug efflux pump subunit AcrA (membrane-fusion protein)